MDGKRIITGTLKNGFNYTVDLDTVESMEFVDTLAEMEENPLNFSKAVKLLLGVEQRKELYKHLEGHGIKANVDNVSEILVEIMTAQSETKNL